MCSSIATQIPYQGRHGDPEAELLAAELGIDRELVRLLDGARHGRLGQHLRHNDAMSPEFVRGRCKTQTQTQSKRQASQKTDLVLPARQRVEQPLDHLHVEVQSLAHLSLHAHRSMHNK